MSEERKKGNSHKIVLSDDDEYRSGRGRGLLNDCSRCICIHRFPCIYTPAFTAQSTPLRAIEQARTCRHPRGGYNSAKRISSQSKCEPQRDLHGNGRPERTEITLHHAYTRDGKREGSYHRMNQRARAVSTAQESVGPKTTYRQGQKDPMLKFRIHIDQILLSLQ